MFGIASQLPEETLWVGLTFAAYLLGSMPTGYWLVKAKTGEDIRTIGSGSTGATNVKRVLGSKAAILVMVVDMLKSLIPLLLVRAYLPELPWLHVAMAVAAIVGHSKSVFLGFTGGKSAATGLGSILGLAPIMGLALGLVAFTLFKLTRTVSIASMTAALLAPIALTLAHKPVAYITYAGMAALYVIYLHRANIQRLLSGTENRLV